MAPEPKPLFAEPSLFQFLNQRRETMKAEIKRLGADFLQASVAELRAQFESKYRVAPLLLGGAADIVEHGETEIDLTGDSRAALYLHPSRAKGTRVVFAIPFQGDPQLFRFQPGTFSSLLPKGIVAEGELRIVIRSLSRNPSDIRGQFDRMLENVREHIAWSVAEIQSFNTSIGAFAARLIELRQKELADAANTIQSLGFPIRKPVAPETPPAAPPAQMTSCRKPRLSRSAAASSDDSDLEHYDRILDKIKGMARSVESLTKAFGDANEQILRDHLLVPLNADYPGTATGETNCGDGRPDILVRHRGRTMFIGECKVWGGRQTIQDGIKQLLGYCNWQVTQTALILFIRNQKISVVLDLIRDTVPAHPQFKQAVPERSSDTALCYAFEQTNDPGREMLLTVLPLHLPAKVPKLEAPVPPLVPAKAPKRRSRPSLQK